MVVKLALLRGLSRSVLVHVFAYLTVFLRVLLFAGSLDSTVRLWEVATQRELAVLTGHTDSVTSVAFDGSGKYLASGGARGATSSSVAVFVMLLKRYFLRCIVRAQLLLRIVFLLFASVSYIF
jgi:WD40 repeat protein